MLYNDALGIEVPSDEEIVEPATPPNLNAIDFDQLPVFRSGIGLAETDAVIQKYLFRQEYTIYPPGPTQSIELPPVSRVAIYMDYLEVGLRMPTTRFFRDNLRYWRVRITQLVPNSIPILVGF